MKAIDALGNTDPTPAVANWTIDTTPPLTSATPAGGAYSSAQLVTLTASEAATIRYTLNGATPTTGSPVYSSPIPISATTTLQFFAVDAAGNTETVKSVTYVIDTTLPDTTAPETTLTAQPASLTTATSANFSFTASEAGATFQCRLDGGAFAACASPQSYSGLGAGAHSFSVKATDAAGNTDPTPASSGWTISFADDDNDGVPDGGDNCPSVANPNQLDSDHDGSGDACDELTDRDGDGLADSSDDCPADADNDADGDGVCGDVDNCPTMANQDQSDANQNGRGDVCDSLIGTDGDDILFGTYGDDTISGLAGRDIIYTGLGNDSVDGGAGIDTVGLPLFPNVYQFSLTGVNQYTVQYLDFTTFLDNVEFVEFGTSIKTTLPIDQRLFGSVQTGLGHLADLYLAFFGRAPHVEGLEYWQEQFLEKGMSFKRNLQVILAGT